MQRFSLFHGTPELTLKTWHKPYSKIFERFSPVLDVGCGLGYFSDLLSEQGTKCIGVDIDPEMVKATESRGHEAYHSRTDSITKLQNYFGGIHISHVVEHLWGEELVAMVDQCTAQLREGGLLVIRTPNWEHPEVRNKVFWLDHTHRRPYGIESLTRILGDFGYTIESSGSEPYGLKDLFVIGSKGESLNASKQIVPDFSIDPFPKPPISSIVRNHLRRLLKRS